MSGSTLQVIDQNGVRGTLDLTVIPPQGSESRLVLIRFDDGRSAFIDGNAFVQNEQGGYSYPASFAALTTNEQTDSTNANWTNAQSANAHSTNVEKIIVPILAEELKIARQKVVTGGVRVHKTVQERTETVDQPIFQENIEVQRVPINQFVEEPPQVRYEGDVMVIPLLEETLVVEKRLVLREEVRIVKRSKTVNHPQEVVVRREEATLERIQPEANNQVGNTPVDEQTDRREI
jgi:uncharacterized protein (TIGR02271 family)